MKILGKLILGVVLVFMGVHFLVTCCPIPLFRIDHLRNPQRVLSIENTALILEGQSRINIPHILQIPRSNAVFKAAISHGVEVCETGRVYGLIKMHHYCGNDPMRYDRRKVNLTELIGTIEPSSLDIPIDSVEKVQIVSNLSVHAESLSSYSDKSGWRMGNEIYLEYVKYLLKEKKEP
jgi:hypothetical protein